MSRRRRISTIAAVTILHLNPSLNDEIPPAFILFQPSRHLCLHVHVRTHSPTAHHRRLACTTRHSLATLSPLATSLAQVIAHKLAKAIEVIDDSQFAALTIESNIHAGICISTHTDTPNTNT